MDDAPLDLPRLGRGIASLATAFDLIYMPEVDSTNRVAAELPRARLRTGAVVLTEYQWAGRGRRDRTWVAPPRTGLLMSLVVDSPPVPGDALLLVALAVAGALREEGVDARIKWPNDVLARNRKICGILAEQIRRDDRRFVVVGAGLNVLSHPDIPGAGSLVEALGRPVDRTGLAIRLFKCIDMWYRSLSEQPDAVFDAWKGQLETIGQDVVVTDLHGPWTGRAVGVERNGGLRVQLQDGTSRVIYSGDVSIRGA